MALLLACGSVSDGRFRQRRTPRTLARFPDQSRADVALEAGGGGLDGFIVGGLCAGDGGLCCGGNNGRDSMMLTVLNTLWLALALASGSPRAANHSSERCVGALLRMLLASPWLLACFEFHRGITLARPCSAPSIHVSAWLTVTRMTPARVWSSLSDAVGELVAAGGGGPRARNWRHVHGSLSEGRGMSSGPWGRSRLSPRGPPWRDSGRFAHAMRLGSNGGSTVAPFGC